MMAVLCTDGQLNFNDLTSECIKGKWIPLLVFRQKKDDYIYLPVFSIEDTAKDFIKRNLPKKWTHAGINLSDNDLKSITVRGWKLEHFSFPRKISGIPDIQLGFEIHEFELEPDYTVGKL
mgnify:CR=1 FL=1